MSHFAFFSPPSFAFVYLSSFLMLPSSGQPQNMPARLRFPKQFFMMIAVLITKRGFDESICRVLSTNYGTPKHAMEVVPNVKLYMPHVFCGSQGKIPQKATLSPSPKELGQNYRFRNCSPIFLATQFCDHFFFKFLPHRSN